MPCIGISGSRRWLRGPLDDPGLSRRGVGLHLRHDDAEGGGVDLGEVEGGDGGPGREELLEDLWGHLGGEGDASGHGEFPGALGGEAVTSDLGLDEGGETIEDLPGGLEADVLIHGEEEVLQGLRGHPPVLGELTRERVLRLHGEGFELPAHHRIRGGRKHRIEWELQYFADALRVPPERQVAADLRELPGLKGL